MKKFQTILMSMLAVATLASCNKDVEGPAKSETASMKFQISVPSTYAIQDAGTAAAPTLTSVKVELLKGASVLETRVLTSTEITDAQSTTGVILEQIPDAATSVKVMANALATASKAIADYQTTLAAVPFSGSAAITDPGVNNADGHKLKKAEVTIKAEVARVEIKGGINVTEAANGCYAVDVKEVYINNYLATSDATSAHFCGNDGAGNWVAANNTFATDKMMNTITVPTTGSFYATDHNVGILNNKVDAYHIFPAAASAAGDKVKVEEELMHVVLKVAVYETAAKFAANEPMADRKWITIKSFKNGTTLIDEFEAGKIYTLDLNDLTVKFVPGVTPPVDPDPEDKKADLELKVKVTPWVLVNMTPNI